MNAIDYAAPKSLKEATALLAEHGDRARALAGGTDVIVQVREGRRDLDLLVDVKHIPELNELKCGKDGLVIGAAVPCCLVYENAEIAKKYPGLIDAVAMIGGIQIQSRASIGGNLCNASPAADTIPPLIVHRAVCVIAGPKGTREAPVESFCTAPGKTALAKGELLVCLKMPAPAKNWGAGYLRFIPRNEMDIAVAGSAVALTLDDSKKKCTSAHVALAAVAPTPLYVQAAGAALVDGEINDALIDKVAAAAQQAANPISDLRGDADYRKHLVGVLTKRALRMALERAQA